LTYFCRYPGVYTELSYYSAWIKAQEQDCSRAPSASGQGTVSSLASMIAGLIGLGRSVNGTNIGAENGTNMNTNLTSSSPTSKISV
jgi:hypothetical protein